MRNRSSSLAPVTGAAGSQSSASDALGNAGGFAIRLPPSLVFATKYEIVRASAAR